MSDAAFTHDVFLKPNQADKPRVRRLAERLRAAGVQFRLDERKTPTNCDTDAGRSEYRHTPIDVSDHSAVSHGFSLFHRRTAW